MNKKGSSELPVPLSNQFMYTTSTYYVFVQSVKPLNSNFFFLNVKNKKNSLQEIVICVFLFVSKFYKRFFQSEQKKLPMRFHTKACKIV